MHYGRSVLDQIAKNKFVLRPNFGTKLWAKL